MGDDRRVPWVTKAGMDRSGRAIIGWVATRKAFDVSNAFDALSADRTPEFPTIADEYVRDDESYGAVHVPEASVPAGVPAFILVGLVGLVGLCAIYPSVVLWLLAVASGATSLTLWPITIGIAATLSVVLALLAERWIPGRVALLLIAVVPFAVKLASSAIPGASG